MRQGLLLFMLASNLVEEDGLEPILLPLSLSAEITDSSAPPHPDLCLYRQSPEFCSWRASNLASSQTLVVLEPVLKPGRK